MPPRPMRSSMRMGPMVAPTKLTVALEATTKRKEPAALPRPALHKRGSVASDLRSRRAWCQGGCVCSIPSDAVVDERNDLAAANDRQAHRVRGDQNVGDAHRGVPTALGLNTGRIVRGDHVLQDDRRRDAAAERDNGM